MRDSFNLIAIILGVILLLVTVLVFVTDIKTLSKLCARLGKTVFPLKPVHRECLGVVSAIVTLFCFLTGWQSLPQIVAKLASALTPVQHKRAMGAPVAHHDRHVDPAPPAGRSGTTPQLQPKQGSASASGDQPPITTPNNFNGAGGESGRLEPHPVSKDKPSEPVAPDQVTPDPKPQPEPIPPKPRWAEAWRDQGWTDASVQGRYYQVRVETIELAPKTVRRRDESAYQWTVRGNFKSVKFPTVTGGFVFSLDDKDHVATGEWREGGSSAPYLIQGQVVNGDRLVFDIKSSYPVNGPLVMRLNGTADLGVKEAKRDNSKEKIESAMAAPD